MSPVHVVRFGAGRARRYLAQAETGGDPEGGWRPLVWTRDYARAEKFASASDARAFALDRLGHARWEIGRAAPAACPPATPTARRRRSGRPDVDGLDPAALDALREAAPHVASAAGAALGDAVRAQQLILLALMILVIVALWPAPARRP